MRKSKFCGVSSKKHNDLIKGDTNTLDFCGTLKDKHQTAAFHTPVWVKKSELGDSMTAEKLLSCQLTAEIS